MRKVLKNKNRDSIRPPGVITIYLSNSSKQLPCLLVKIVTRVFFFCMKYIIDNKNCYQISAYKGQCPHRKTKIKGPSPKATF